jgi:hypothetical protein
MSDALDSGLAGGFMSRTCFTAVPFSAEHINTASGRPSRGARLCRDRRPSRGFWFHCL